MLTKDGVHAAAYAPQHKEAYAQQHKQTHCSAARRCTKHRCTDFIRTSVRKLDECVEAKREIEHSINRNFTRYPSASCVLASILSAAPTPETGPTARVTFSNKPSPHSTLNRLPVTHSAAVSGAVRVSEQFVGCNRGAFAIAMSHGSATVGVWTHKGCWPGGCRTTCRGVAVIINKTTEQNHDD